MATSTVDTNKKCCIKCNGIKRGGGLFTCDGCQQIFCGPHVAEHRQELSVQLENAMQEHDLIQQESNRSTLDQTILSKIDAWEKETIVKIQKIAETTRANFRQFHQITDDRIKTECTQLAKSLLLARETDDFSEADLIKWNQLLTNLRTQLESMTKVNIIEDKQSYINPIKVQYDIHWSKNDPLQKDSNLMTKNYLNNTIIQSSTNRNENQDLQTSSRPPRLNKMRSDGNHAKNPECKQQ
jgi:hypothetical protein